MDNRTYLAVYRPRQSEAFDQQTLGFLRTIQPHVQRSLKLSLLLSSATSERSMFHAMLGAVSKPMLACSAKAEIQYANAAAEALLRKNDGLGTDGRRLVAATPGHTDRLVRAIGKAAGAASPDETQTGQTLQVPHRSSGRPLTVTVIPLPQNDDRLLGMRRAAALVVVHVPRQLHETELAILRATHALTAAEIRLVASMLDGGGLPQVAARLGIGHSTARTHLKHIFAKTHTRRQAELVELVHRLVH
jgi:DNA-binding CsgD family transcriptional regulator